METRGDKRWPLVAFGDPHYRPGASFDGQPIRDVPLMGEVAMALAKELQGKAFIGGKVTRSMVLTEAPAGRNVVLAMHAFANEGYDPLSSCVALGPGTHAESYDMLTAQDVIQDLKLNADLVVLAGCETGRGLVTGAEGVMGLARAFQYAGAKSVLCTLWETDAAGAGRLLCGFDGSFATSFFGARRAGQTKDQALRTAQMAMIHGDNGTYRNPCYWAAFSLVGDRL